MRKFFVVFVLWVAIFFIAELLTHSKPVAVLVMLALGIAVVPLAERMIAFWTGFTSRRAGPPR
jgi:hypothetical protein